MTIIPVIYVRAHRVNNINVMKALASPNAIIPAPPFCFLFLFFLVFFFFAANLPWGRLRVCSTVAFKVPTSLQCTATIGVPRHQPGREKNKYYSALPMTNNRTVERSTAYIITVKTDAISGHEMVFCCGRLWKRYKHSGTSGSLGAECRKNLFMDGYAKA